MGKIDHSIVGKKFGRLTVLEFVEKIKQEFTSRVSCTTMWKCVCDCGQIKIVERNRLVNGGTNSCGCLDAERINKLSEKQIQKNILLKGEASLNRFINDYKYCARERDFSFELTKEQFKKFVFGNCWYCGTKPERIYPSDKRINNRPVNGRIIVNGIDRVDTNKGYYFENCVSCCEICNKAKRNLSLDVFNSWINRLVEFNIKKDSLYFENMIKNAS